MAIKSCSISLGIVAKKAYRWRNDFLDPIDHALLNELKASRSAPDLSDEFQGLGFGYMVSHRLFKMDLQKSALTMAKIDCLLY